VGLYKKKAENVSRGGGKRNPEIEQPTAPDGNKKKKPRKIEQLTQRKT
jgi:hypothetical protein